MAYPVRISGKGKGEEVMQVVEPTKALRLLLVEDNPGDEELVREWLTDDDDCRFEISAVDTLQLAQESLASDTFDAVILDLSLPDSSGADGISRLREVCDTVPIMVLSGSATDDIKLEAYRAGAQDFLGKNESPGLMLAKGILYTVERFCTQMGQQYLERIVAVNPDAVLVIDRSGKVRYANGAALRLFDKSRPAFIGSDFGFFVHDGMTMELDIPRPQGPAVAEMRVVRMEWEGESAFLATLRDMTEYKQIEAQLRQSQKMDAIGQLAGGVAHDFNNLLTIINGYVEVLQSGQNLTDAQREMVDSIADAGERATALTTQLLAFSRRTNISTEYLDINEVLDDFAKLLKRLIGEDVMLALNLTADKGIVLADRAQLEQIVVNLAVNARDAMGSRGHIEFKTQIARLDQREIRTWDGAWLPAGAYVQLTVSDDGPGMRAQVRERIFEPFFTTKEEGKGTGLGLATVRTNVEEMKGAIVCESEPGTGTTFCVYLPAQAEDRLARQDEPAPTVEAHQTGSETVLLVEDDPGVRQLISLVLCRKGYTVLEAAGGPEGFAMAESHDGPIALLITDVVMPDLSGPELGAAVAKIRPGTAVLYLSGYNDDEILRRGVAADNLNFLQKPFSAPKLLEKVRTILDQNSGVPGR